MCQYKIILPILNKYNIQAAWGICSSPLQNIPIFLEIYKYFQGLYFINDDEFYNSFFDIIIKNKKYMDYLPHLNDKEQINNYRKNLDFYTFNDRKFRYMRDLIKDIDFINIIKYMMINKNFKIAEHLNKIWINEDMVKKLHKSQIICSHSHSHPTLMNRMDLHTQNKEICKSINILENIIESKINIFCCPCDNYNQNTIKILEKKNILGLIGKDAHILNKNLINRIDFKEFINIYPDPSFLLILQD